MCLHIRLCSKQYHYYYYYHRSHHHHQCNPYQVHGAPYYSIHNIMHLAATVIHRVCVAVLCAHIGAVVVLTSYLTEINSTPSLLLSILFL